MGQKRYDYDLPFDDDDGMQWYHRVVCPCQWWRVYGYPCIHAWMCMQYLPQWVKNYNGLSHRNLINLDPTLWHYRLKKWFFGDYHLRNMLAQCGTGFQSFVLPRDLTQEQCYQIYPPNAKMPQSKRINARFKSGSGKKSTVKKPPTTTAITTGGIVPAPAAASNFLMYDDDVPIADAATASVQAQAPKAIRECLICKATDHNSRTCPNKTSESSLGLSSFLPKMIKMPNLSKSEWEDLQLEPWNGTEGEQLRAETR